MAGGLVSIKIGRGECKPQLGANMGLSMEISCLRPPVTRPGRLGARMAGWQVLLMLPLLLKLCGTAWAGRPLQTEDAGVLEQGECELESYTARQHVKQASHDRGASLQLACGLGRSTQLALALQRNRGDGEASRGQLWSGKTRLWSAAAEAPEGASLTLAYGLGWRRDVNRAWHQRAGNAALVFSTPLGEASPLSLHAQLGHAHEKSEGLKRRSTSWGLALEHQGWGAVAPMAELFGDDRDGTWWNLGLRVTLRPETLFVYMSYGRKLGAGPAPRLLTLGLKLSFGGP